MLDNLSIISLAAPARSISHLQTPAHKCKLGAPVQTFHKHFETADGLFTVGLWECEAGSFTVQFTGHEFAHLLEGEIHIEDENGRILQFLPGMQLVFPAGYSGTWHVLQKARKAFTWHELEPVAAAEVEAQ